MLLSACGGGSGSITGAGGGGSGTTGGSTAIGAIHVSFGATSAVADGASQTAIIAQVTTDTGQPLTGATVSFSTTAGALSAASAVSNNVGNAQVLLTSPVHPGTATVRASSAGFSDVGTVAFVSGGAHTVTLSASPATVAPNRTSSITAQVFDASGNPVGNESVNFSIPAGTGTLNGSSGAITVTSDGNGLASASFTPTAVPPTGTTTPITITATANPEGVSGSTVVTVNPAAVAPTGLAIVALTASAPADGASQVAVQATVTGSDGSPLSGVSVTFTTSIGSPSSMSATTNVSGQAVFAITAPTSPGTATVSAATAGLRQTTSVNFTAGAPTGLTLTLGAPSVPDNGSVAVRATVLDSHGFPSAGVAVLFDVKTNSSGGQLASTSVVTDANGSASTTYTAGSAFTTVVDTIRARVTGIAGEQTANLNVTVTFAQLVLKASSPSIPADGSSSTSIIATVTDTNQKPVSGAPVSFKTSAGKFTGNVTTIIANTDSTGTATATLIAPTTAGSATVTATAGGTLTGSTAVKFVAGAPTAVTITASPVTVALGAPSTITANVVDANGNPASGVDLQFSVPTNASGGVLTNVSVTTDANGRATTTYTAGATAGTDKISARTAGGVISNQLSVIVSGASVRVSKLLLTLGAASVSAGTPSVAVQAAVTDTNGNPVPGLSVSFTTTAGSLSAPSATTDSTGVAIVQLTPPTVAGIVQIQALASGFVQQQTLTVVPGAAVAARSAIAASPSTLVADGVSTTTVTVFLNDGFGNPLPDGTNVTLLTTAGTITGGNTKPLASGGVSFTLKSPSSPASATVSVQGVTGLSTTVSFATSSSGDPASIRFAVSTNRVSVTGVGQVDTDSITITVLDSSGNVIRESGYANAPINNLRVKFITSPNGGETIAGNNVSSVLQTAGYGGFIDVATQGGVAVVNLRAGTLPGIVELSASALSFAGTSLANPGDIATTAVIPQISIASGPPTTIVFSTPFNGSIVNLGNGSYQRSGDAHVTDRYGNSVSDGTVVNFTLMDSTIVHDLGTTSAAGTTLVHAGFTASNSNNYSLITRNCATQPTAGSPAANCTVAGNFLTGIAPTPPLIGVGSLSPLQTFQSPVVRNGAPRTLQPNDRVMVGGVVTPAVSPAPPALPVDSDLLRSVTSVDSATQLTVNSPYNNALGGAEFWAGASLLGGQIFGTDASGNLTFGTGVTKNGIAQIRVSYPANVGSILTGCYAYPYPVSSVSSPAGSYQGSAAAYSDRDLRDAVPQSRQVVVAASSGPTATAVTQGRFCFSAISGVTVTPANSAIALTATSSRVLTLLVRDGGDKIPLPFTGVSCGISAFTRSGSSFFALTTAVVPNSDGDRATGVDGYSAVTITRTDSGPAASGDTATVTCSSLDGTTSITVTPILP